jgi:hypothetical protein
MKQFGLIISTLFASVIVGQTKSSIQQKINPSSAFKLSLTTFNHATLLFKGTTTYLLTDKSIKIIKTPFGEKKSTIVFSKPLLSFQDSSALINNFGLDSLKDIYDNYCVMVTSGDEYFLDYNGNSMKKKISLHHYYLKPLDDIVKLINSFLPESFHFIYLKKDTRQDCSP